MKEHFGYFIVDSFGCIGGSLRTTVKNLDGSETEWCYTANRNATQWHNSKELALAEIEQLKELNEVAQIPGLSWELVYANRNDFPVYPTENQLPNLFILSHDIPKGCISKHKKIERAIRKKYKPIFVKIAKEFVRRMTA
ncbi:hypothetical protein [Desulforamulus aeronauticus]|uniref:Uncharacterized protein n=1 Tax=Desulforamulus aeronauticus DSM 10349 TaxID=1121421 RepID=A0A1M6SAN9_9FIRM|nr:hypothetical protein [Desulforamulus aeronauticus]SHK41775.1 hypothetical protein SAMN02745123_01771 [Desulforamulus aeronauticus DSM 10349]